MKTLYRRGQEVYCGFHFEFDNREWGKKIGPIKYTTLDDAIDLMNANIKKLMQRNFNIENVFPQNIKYHVGEIFIMDSQTYYKIKDKENTVIDNKDGLEEYELRAAQGKNWDDQEEEDEDHELSQPTR